MVVVVVAFLAACRSFQYTLQFDTAAQTWRPGHRRGGKYLLATGRFSGGKIRYRAEFVRERVFVMSVNSLYPCSEYE